MVSIFVRTLVTLIALLLIIQLLWHLQQKASRFDSTFPTVVSYKLLIATSLSHGDMATYIRAMRLYRNTSVKFALNCHEGNRTREHLEVYIHEAGMSNHVLSLSTYPGAKAFFWKNILTPDVVASYDILWLPDSDMGFGLDEFQLREFLSMASTTQAPIFQPAVSGLNGKKGTIFSELQANTSASEFSATCIVEVMTPSIRSEFWPAFYRQGLAHMTDELLMQSAWGIADWWCDLASSVSLNTSQLDEHTWIPSCLVVQTTPIVHSDTKTMIRRGGEGGNDRRSIALKPWKQHAQKLNIRGQCKTKLSQARHRQIYSKEPTLTVNMASSESERQTNGVQPPAWWKARAAAIYERHRQQNISHVQRLNNKWRNKTLIGVR
jgi:hypothetical protein